MKIGHIYNHGLPFSEKLGENLNDLDDRIQKKFAALLIIDGGVGQGKTTLMVEVMDYINKLHGLPEISLDQKDHPQIAMGGEQFLKQLRVCFDKKLPVIGYDEAGDFNRRGSLTRFNAMINRTFETFRAFKILVILSLPSFHVLDNDLFDKNIPRMLLHLENRTQKQGNFRGYSLYRALYIKHKMKKLVVKSIAYQLVEPNFYGHFLDLSPERSKQLDILSTKGKMSHLRKSEIEIQGLLSYSDLAKKLGRSMLWTRIAVNKLKVKHKAIIDRKKYFDDEALNRLADYLDEFDKRRTNR